MQGGTSTIILPPLKEVLKGDEHLGVTVSYWELLKHSIAESTMFADQDDVWHANKIAVTLDAMRKLEDIHGKKTPLLDRVVNS